VNAAALAGRANSTNPALLFPGGALELPIYFPDLSSSGKGRVLGS
jgi:hypothetical protein